MHAAQVYLRLPHPPAGQHVHASIRGPYCKHSATLPATIRLRDAGPGDTLLLKATVPDPCYWSPDLPAQYDVQVEWREDAASVAVRQTTLRVGVRLFGAAGEAFRQEGQRKVLRALRRDSLAELPHPSMWREASGSLWIAAPDDAFCREASEQGIRLLVDLGESSNVASEVRRLRMHASVTTVCLGANSADPTRLETLRRIAPNLLFGQRWDSATPSWPPKGTERPDFLVARWSDEFSVVAESRPRDLPLILERPLTSAGTFSSARQQCDQLQRDAAKFGDFAGYLV